MPRRLRTSIALAGGSANDTVTLAAVAVNASIDLGTGNNTLTLGNFGDTVSTSNVGTLIGGTGSDVVTLDAAAGNASISLGVGAHVPAH